MTAYVIDVTIRAEAPDGSDEDGLAERITAALWTGLTPLVEDGGLDEVSHVDVDMEPEEAE